MNEFRKKFNTSDLFLFFNSLIFYDLSFKTTRNFYYAFENSLDYYFSFFDEIILYESYSFLFLCFLISITTVFFKNILRTPLFIANLFSLLSCFTILKIFNFPRSHLLINIFSFPLIYFLINKIKLKTNIKFLILLFFVFISFSFQPSFFSSRKDSYIQNIKAQDIAYVKNTNSLERTSLYKTFNYVVLEETLSFDDNTEINTYFLCCNALSQDSTNTGRRVVGYIEKYNENLFYVNGYGEFFYFNLDHMMNNSKSIELVSIDSNIKSVVNNEFLTKNDERFVWGGWESVRSLTLIADELFVSVVEEVDKECTNLKLINAKVDLNYLDFKVFFEFDECINRSQLNYTPAASGGKILDLDDNYIVVSIGDWLDYSKAQNLDSLFGKVIKINKITKNYEIISFGHRNPQGMVLIKEKNIILSTEHGPKMGDEINIIDLSNSEIENFGWPISSYGVPYGPNYGINFFNFESNPDAPMYKSHKNYGFKEPLYYFGTDKLPEQGISDIELIKQQDNYNFLVGTLQYGHIYKFEIDLEKNSVLNINSYNLNNRVRDILQIKPGTLLVLQEKPPKISVIEFGLDNS